jgi:hypothetical protein
MGDHYEPLRPCGPPLADPSGDSAMEVEKAYDENGFDVSFPKHHRDTGTALGPDGTTWNGFRADETHKDTNTKIGPRGKTWREEQTDLIREYFGDLGQA